MKEKMLYKSFLILMIVVVVIAYMGCEKTNKRAEQPLNDKVTADTNTTRGYREEPKDTIVTAKIKIPDLKGTYSGIFDGRSSVLTITEQTDSSFSGKITINYRQVVNQEIKGTLKPTTKEITMTDQLNSNFQGKYKGELSADNNNFTGTFTMDRDGSKYSFNLKKK